MHVLKIVDEEADVVQTEGDDIEAVEKRKDVGLSNAYLIIYNHIHIYT